MAEVRKRGDEFWGEFEFYLSDLMVGLVLDVVLVGLLAPVALKGRKPRAQTGCEGACMMSMHAVAFGRVAACSDAGTCRPWGREGRSACQGGLNPLAAQMAVGLHCPIEKHRAMHATHRAAGQGSRSGWPRCHRRCLRPPPPRGRTPCSVVWAASGSRHWSTPWQALHAGWSARGSPTP